MSFHYKGLVYPTLKMILLPRGISFSTSRGSSSYAFSLCTSMNYKHNLTQITKQWY